MIKKSFAFRVLALCFFMLTLPLFIDTFFFFKNSYTASVKEVKSNLTKEGITRAFALEEKLSIDTNLVDGFAYILDKKSKEDNFSKKVLNKTLKELHEITPNYNFLIIQLSKDERVNKIIGASDAALIGQKFKWSNCFQMLLDGKESNFIRRFYNRKTHSWDPNILSGKRLSLDNFLDEKFVIIVYSDISAYLKKILTPSKKPDIYFAIVQYEGFISLASDPELIGQIIPFLAVDKEAWKRVRSDRLGGDIKLSKTPLQIAQDEPRPFFEFFFKGEIQLAYFRPIPVCGSYLVAYTEEHAFFAEGIKNFLIVYCFYGIIMILGGGITFWFTLLLSRPLQQLAMVMNKVAENNLQVRFKKTPLGYEVNFLGDVFNKTLDTLLDNMQKLEGVKVEKEAVKRELAVGKEVQNRLIPQPSLITDSVEIEGRYRSGLNVGGDFHDYLILRNGKEIALVVADSSGKGISSCLYALSLRSLLRSNLTLSENLGEILQATNNSFLDLAGDTGMFVTVLMGMYYVETSILDYYSCGHPPGFVIRGEELIELEHTGGLAMGLIEIENLQPYSIQLQKGDFLFFFTDGLISAMNAQGIIFSKKRLIQALKSQKWSSAKELVQTVITILGEFIEREDEDNELTLLVMKVK